MINTTIYFRYLVVCQAATMVGREKDFGHQIVCLSVCTSLGIGLTSLIYRENMRMFLECMGKSEWFILDLQNPFLTIVGGSAIKLNFFNPFRLSVNTVVFAFFVVVPILYYKIFRFRQKQDTSIAGMAKHKISY